MTEQHQGAPVQPAPQFAVAALQEEIERLHKQLSATEDRAVYLRAMQMQSEHVATEIQLAQSARINELEGEVTRIRAENDQLSRQVDENNNQLGVLETTPEAQEAAFAILPASESAESPNGHHEHAEPQE